MRLIKLYGKFFGIHLKSQMQYKGSFFLMFLGQFFIAFSGFLEIWFMFSRFHQVEGFTMGEVFLCFSAVNIAFSLAEVFVRGFDAFSSMISGGEFDRVLLRPRNTVFLVLASKMDFSRLGKLFQGVLIMWVALTTSGVQWNWERAVTYALMIVGGTVVFSALFVIYASVCFFTIQGLEVMNIFTDGSREFGQYPVKIYGEGVLRFLTWVVPVALFQYYPLLFLLGRTDSPLYMLCPLLCFLFLIPAYLLWRFGLRHYTSTGS